MRLITVSHGEVVNNGYDAPSELTAASMSKARQVGRSLCRIPIERVYSSGEQPSNITAGLIVDAIPTKPRVVYASALRNVEFGQAELSVADLARREQSLLEASRYHTGSAIEELKFLHREAEDWIHKTVAVNPPEANIIVVASPAQIRALGAVASDVEYHHFTADPLRADTIYIDSMRPLQVPNHTFEFEHMLVAQQQLATA